MARPRDAEIDRKLLDAARHLLDEVGYDELTMEAVAAEAGVGKPSLYRRYPSKAHLLFEVQAVAMVPAELPDTGSFRGDLVALAIGTATAIADSPPGVGGDRLVKMSLDRDFAEDVLQRYLLLVLRQQHTLWERGVERGEVDPTIDGMGALRDLASAIWVRVDTLHEPPTEETVGPMVDRLIRGAAPRP